MYFYVVRSPVFRLQRGEFSEKLRIFSKVKKFQNLSCPILEKINENHVLSHILCCRLNVVITVLRDEKKIKEKILHNMQEKNSRSLAVKSHETLFNFLPMVQGYVKLGSL